MRTIIKLLILAYVDLLYKVAFQNSQNPEMKNCISLQSIMDQDYR